MGVHVPLGPAPAPAGEGTRGAEVEGSRGFCWWVARAWAGGRAVCPCARTPSSPPTLFPVAPPPHSPQYGGWAGDQVVRDYSAYADLVFTEFGRKARAGGGVEGSRAFAGCVRRWGGGCEGRHGGERGAAGLGPATPARPPARPPPPSPPCTPHLPPPQVKNWSTFNEPRTFCTLGYGVGAHAPGIKARNWGVLEVGRGGGAAASGGGRWGGACAHACLGGPPAGPTVHPLLPPDPPTVDRTDVAVRAARIGGPCQGGQTLPRQGGAPGLAGWGPGKGACRAPAPPLRRRPTHSRPPTWLSTQPWP